MKPVTDIKLVTAEHGHMWINITTIDDFYRMFLCNSCNQKMSAPRSWTRQAHRFEGDTAGNCVLCSGRVELFLHTWPDP